MDVQGRPHLELTLTEGLEKVNGGVGEQRGKLFQTEEGGKAPRKECTAARGQCDCCQRAEL